MATPISRRALLRATGTSSLAMLLAACVGNEPETPADSGDISNQAVAAVGLDATPTLTAIIATFEVLTGVTGRIPFGVLDESQEPMLDRDVQLWVVRDGEVVAGPVEPLFYGEGLGARGIYIAPVELSEPGLFDAVVQVDGGPVGVAPFTARRPQDSTSYPPGAEFPVISTPTEADPGALEALCTADPPCSMHEVSLDTVLGTGPVVFTVATPRFCQTAVCGPVVEVVEDLRDQLGRDDVTFLHAEVYNDAGVTTTAVVDELALPSEPWTWVIDAEGVIVDRFDGPVVPSLVAEAIQRA